MDVIKKLFNAAPCICSVIGCIYILSGNSPWIIVPSDSSFHFNIITVNALFGGFLYTNYSLLIGLLDNSIAEKIKHTEIINKRNSHILKGIVYATISVVAGLYIVLIPPSSSPFSMIVFHFMQNAEVAFMAFLILYFLLSLKEMSELVNAIHKSDGKKSVEDIDALKEKIRSGFK